MSMRAALVVLNLSMRHHNTDDDGVDAMRMTPGYISFECGLLVAAEVVAWGRNRAPLRARWKRWAGEKG